MNRKEVLNTALSITTGDRQKQHGSPQETFNAIADLWSSYTGKNLSAVDVCNMMVLLKVARTQHGATNMDDFVDQCGYASLAAELSGGKA